MKLIETIVEFKIFIKSRNIAYGSIKVNNKQPGNIASYRLALVINIKIKKGIHTGFS
jgi:hypothetical protein